MQAQLSPRRALQGEAVAALGAGMASFGQARSKPNTTFFLKLIYY